MHVWCELAQYEGVMSLLVIQVLLVHWNTALHVHAVKALSDDNTHCCCCYHAPAAADGSLSLLLLLLLALSR
jgi:hypothetical protein